MKLFRALSLSAAGWRAQLTVAYSLMAIIPLLTSGYLIMSYILPNIVTTENLLVMILLTILISLGGFLILFKTIKSLIAFRNRLQNIANGNLDGNLNMPDDPDASSITSSLEKIVCKMLEDNRRLTAFSADLEEKIRMRTQELRDTNLRLEEELSVRERVEAELRKSNMSLSDALVKLKQMQEHMIQQERMTALGQMASGIAHDINNALMPIIGLSDLLLNAVLSRRSRIFTGPARA